VIFESFWWGLFNGFVLGFAAGVLFMLIVNKKRP